MENMNKHCICFVGRLGSGKTTIANIVAHKLGYRFLEVSDIVKQLTYLNTNKSRFNELTGRKVGEHILKQLHLTSDYVISGIRQKEVVEVLSKHFSKIDIIILDLPSKVRRRRITVREHKLIDIEKYDKDEDRLGIKEVLKLKGLRISTNQTLEKSVLQILKYLNKSNLPIKFYVIPPINKHDLELAHLGTAGYFCLANFALKNKYYREFMKLMADIGIFVLMGNGVTEHDQVSTKKLLQLVEYIQPNVVVAPDVLLNKEKTIKNTSIFAEKLKRKTLRTSILGCPQGKTKREWLECYKYMLQNKNINMIGLSKIAVPYCWYNKASNDKYIAEARQKCVNYLIKHKLLFKPIHLLGQGHYKEFNYSNPLIVSTDSCYQIYSAMHNISYKKFKRIPTTNSYFYKNLTASQFVLAIDNIKFFERWLYKNTRR